MLRLHAQRINTEFGTSATCTDQKKKKKAFAYTTPGKKPKKDVNIF